MADDGDFQGKMQQLRTRVKEEKEIEKRNRTELERRKDKLYDSKSNYLHLKLENDQIDADLELQHRRKKIESVRCVKYWDNIEKELDVKFKNMNAVLDKMDAEKQVETAMIMQFFRAVKKIPIDFSDEILANTAIEVEEKRKKVTQRIREAEEKIAAETAKVDEETALRQERNDKLDAFAKDVKTVIIEIGAVIRRHKQHK